MYKNKKSSPPIYFNDLYNLSWDKNLNKKQINLNSFIDSDIENEKKSNGIKRFKYDRKNILVKIQKLIREFILLL